MKASPSRTYLPHSNLKNSNLVQEQKFVVSPPATLTLADKMLQESEFTAVLIERDTLKYVLEQKCQEAEAWKSKSEHLEQHLTHFQVSIFKIVERTQSQVGPIHLENSS